MDIVVIGAGVIGAAVAFRVAQAGARVLIVEAEERIGHGTSGRSFAWTNANEKTPRAYFDLNLAGMRAHAALRDEFGQLPWWHGGGSVDWFATEAERTAQRARMERLQAWGYAAEWLTTGDLHHLEPDIDARAVGEAPIGYYPEEGWLDPIPYVYAMLRSAEGHGAGVRLGQRVERVASAGGRVTGVMLTGGERVSADVVVNCAGRWADRIEVHGQSWLKLPLAPTVGLLVFTPPVATGLQRIIRTSRVYLRPDGAGRLMLRADDVDPTTSEETRPSAELPRAHELVQRAAQVLPSIGAVLPEAVRLGVRPIPEDGHSAVGMMPGIEGYYVVVTHSGVTLSPLLARLVANELLAGRREPQLDPFRPSRFFAGTRQPAAEPLR